MGLTKIMLGKYLELYYEECNIPNLKNKDVSGVNKDKEFFEPSNYVGSDTSKYKVVPPGCFACNLMHVGRDVVLPIACNHTKNNKFVSPAYHVFRFKKNKEILREYFFLCLKSYEKDRYFWFNTDGSVRDGMSWSDFTSVEIELPSLEIQKKYVDVYNSMIANQKAYESRLEDLRIVCDGHFDVVKKEKMVPLGTLIEKVDKRNSDGKYGIQDVRGIMNQKQFSETKANVESKDLTKFLVIDKDVFAYNSRTDGREMLVLAVNRCDKSVIVTWNYNAFRIRDEKRRMINTEYLYAFFKRREFDREVRFNSWGSSQELLSWDSLCDLNVPCPDINTQNSIAEINRVYLDRKDINDKLKSVIKDACSVLMKGSIEEAQKEA